MSNEILIAGSGPSGVSAAFPLVKAGIKVTLIDIGKTPKYPSPTGNYLLNRYHDENQSDYLIGKNFESLNNNKFDNPKQRVARHSYLFDNFVNENNIQTNNFTPIGTHAQGGLSNIWGATVATFDDLDFKDSVMEGINLSSNYADIIERIGVSGNLTDDLSNYFGQDHNIQKEPKLDNILNNVLDKYNIKKKIINEEGIKLGRSRNAILTKNLKDRSGCQNCGMCLYGCSIESIYTANYDLRELIKYSNFKYIPG
ncbi:NAD(P)/FAD-dependent oxidoreductase, partial [Alphaproteobacteria bacterium]|nr:NAD(P)/FAD-dependent oxidoreductase [Alphaproteobacteria bacterium]